ncbi:histidine--tRNA ligase [Rosenbergiella epipactidis]|uniref:histidine--tRNA ligase n=1 Tax=Rosenbergiella epipactidis TaxID=1544694 RepID=UPI001BDA4285|nr:histidine--tRNA ligase [Rosenbergiella epipactidis]MBT0717612.1 histidine--tRNA ligase [Rosenbergiella epipactidis]
MSIKTKAVRGMRDVLPEETPIWQWLESKLRRLTFRYGYHEIRLPLLEPVALFERSVGQATDIIAKEMYNFTDKSGEHITLRPEGTSGCMRAVLENNLCYNKTQRIWYQGPMFRYERPQKGRLRQFTQFGVEAFGMKGPDIDAELIFMVRDLLQELELTEYVRLEINSLGTLEERKRHREQLLHWFTAHRDILDEESIKRLETNPLRILDSKNPAMQSMLEQAPKLLDFLNDESRNHFATVCQILDRAAIPYVINPRLVRGLDYYTRTVFEWVTDELGAQGTVCGGGRYDGLAELFNPKALPACGFAIGIERLLLLIQTLQDSDNPCWHFYPTVVVTNELDDDGLYAQLIAEDIRQNIIGLSVVVDCSGSKLKRQHHTARLNQCQIIVTINNDRTIRVWDLISAQQLTVGEKELMNWLGKRCR